MLVGSISLLKPARVAVIGDFILDTYTFGRVKRISPEAPVPVLNVLSTESRLGGVGNVILNLLSLGCSVYPLGRVGKDAAGYTLIEELKKKGLETTGILQSEKYQTSHKNRVIADNQQLVRIDQEENQWLTVDEEKVLKDAYLKAVGQCDLVCISDYAKGTLTPSLLRFIIDQAREKNIPVVVDPKGRDFSRYARATLIKPNLGEAIMASGASDDTSLDEVGKKLLQITHADAIMITKSKDGISIFDSHGRRDFFAEERQVRDVTGAGDTVLATIACALASGLSLEVAAQLANVAAGIAIETIGCATVTIAQIAERLLMKDCTNKVFVENHLFALEQVLKDKPTVVLEVNGSDGIHSKTFESVRKVAAAKMGDLIVYIDTPSSGSDEHFIEWLSSLPDVRYIVLREDHKEALVKLLKPVAHFTST